MVWRQIIATQGRVKITESLLISSTLKKLRQNDWHFTATAMQQEQVECFVFLRNWFER